MTKKTTKNNLILLPNERPIPEIPVCEFCDEPFVSQKDVVSAEIYFAHNPYCLDHLLNSTALSAVEQMTPEQQNVVITTAVGIIRVNGSVEIHDDLSLQLMTLKMVHTQRPDLFWQLVERWMTGDEKYSEEVLAIVSEAENAPIPLRDEDNAEGKKRGFLQDPELFKKVLNESMETQHYRGLPQMVVSPEFLEQGLRCGLIIIRDGVCQFDREKLMEDAEIERELAMKAAGMQLRTQAQIDAIAKEADPQDKWRISHKHKAEDIQGFIAMKCENCDQHAGHELTDVYYCPTAGENESASHGGFDVCCDKPELHEPERKELTRYVLETPGSPASVEIQKRFIGLPPQGSDLIPFTEREREALFEAFPPPKNEELFDFQKKLRDKAVAECGLTQEQLALLRGEKIQVVEEPCSNSSNE